MRKIALFTMIVIICASIFLLGKALLTNVSQPSENYSGADPTKWGLPKTSREIVEKRSATAKHFKNEDGTYTGVFSAAPIHYKDQSGTLQEIELAFTKQEDTYVSEKSLAKTVVEQNKLTTVNPQTGKGIAWIIPTHFTVKNNEAIYEENGITWKYTLTPTGTKLSATVDTRQGMQTYAYRYELVGDAKNLEVDDATGNLIGDGFTIPRAFVIGKNGERYETSEWVLNENHTVSFTFDDTLLPEEALPYVIDPSTSIDTYSESGDIYSNHPNNLTTARNGYNLEVDTSTNNMAVGEGTAGTGLSVLEGFIGFDTSTLPNDAILTGASLKLIPSQIFANAGFILEIRSYNWGPTLTTSDFVAYSGLGSLPLVATCSSNDMSTNAQLPLTYTGNHLLNSATTGKVELILNSSKTRIGGSSTADYVRFYIRESRGPQLILDYNFAPGTLSGTVVDSATSQKIPGALVTISPGNYQVRTAADGTYTLTDIPGDTYTATYQATGYISTQKTVTINSYSTTTEDVSLIDTGTTNGVTRINASDEGYLSRTASGSISWNSSGLNWRRYPEGASSRDMVGFVRWNTSSLLPSGANISKAEFQHTFRYYGPDNFATVGDWVTLSSWPPKSSDFPSSAGTGTAFGPIPQSQIPNSYRTHTFPLSSPATQIKSNDYTTIRIMLDDLSRIPTADNSMVAQSGVVPELIIYWAEQGNLSGTITNSQTSQGVSGATITLSPGNYQTTTDSNGTYSFSNIPARTYSTSFSAPGYITQTHNVTISYNQTTTQNVALVMPPTPTPTPTITPTPTPTPYPAPIYFEGVNLEGINID